MLKTSKGVYPLMRGCPWVSKIGYYENPHAAVPPLGVGWLQGFCWAQV